MVDVYLNGKFVGSTDDAQCFVEKFRSLRRSGKVDATVSISYDEVHDSVFIEADSGRVMRPLIVVKDGKPLLTDEHIKKLEKGEISWDDLIKQGIIEYLDASEEENALVAITPEDLTEKHTHLEIAPFGIFGWAGSLVPDINHSPGARMSVGAKNQKQAVGVYALNYNIRFDMDVHTLHYPQKPIFKTATEDVSGIDYHPVGQNVVVAVGTYLGYNMEDAIVINRGSIDRGFGRSHYYRVESTEELKYPGGLHDTITIPDKDVLGYRSEYDYRYLEEDGIISPEVHVAENDVLVGKVSPPRFLSAGEEYELLSEGDRESSVYLKRGEKGIVDSVIITESSEGNKMVKIKIRDLKIPEIGDKFISRHGQKGVVGLIVDPEDMPFTESGIVPDIIFSHNSLPSRMTFSHMIEMIAGKVGALNGRFVDGTPFESESEFDLRKELQELGFRENGVETMYNPVTGEMYKVTIFIGSMYYLRLKHLVSNKIQARARGPVQILTRQPTEGRSREGGLRLGEMEKDAFVAHGAAMVLKERFSSDNTTIPVCENCGNIAVYDVIKDRAYCPVCGDKSNVVFVQTSYAFKLFLDELKSMQILPRLGLDKKV